MIIVANHTPGKISQTAKKTALISSLSIALIIPLFLILLGQANRPTGNLVSPLPQGELTSATPTPNQTNFAQSLNLAQNFFDKAVALSQNPNQSESDKQQIIANLNQSLTHTNTAINQQPQNPTGYIMRAQILTGLSKINPQAQTQAASDLEIAQKLSQGQTVTLPAAQNPIDLIPNQQASLAQNIIIAGDHSSDGGRSEAEVSSEVGFTRSSTILPARQQQITINNDQITQNSSIYLMPVSPTPVYIQSQSEGQAVIGITTPLSTDLTIDYYIINP